MSVQKYATPQTVPNRAVFNLKSKKSKTQLLTKLTAQPISSRSRTKSKANVTALSAL